MTCDFLIGQFEANLNENASERKSIYQLWKRCSHFISKSYFYALYKRYKETKTLTKGKRGRPKKIFSPSEISLIIKTFENMVITDNKQTRLPSIPFFLKTLYNKYPLLPNASRETFRKILKQSIYYREQPHKNSRRYRRSFEADAIGELVQGDVSIHDWIPGAKPFPLLVFMDDCSRYILYAKFIHSDNIHAHIEAIRTIIASYGKPLAIYYDNDPKYRKNSSKKQHTSFEHRAIISGLQELHIKLINSTPYQPQGKGKIERFFQTIQNQIIFKMKEKDVQTLEEAQEVLDEYVMEYNNRFHNGIKLSPQQKFMGKDNLFSPVNNLDLVDNAFTEKSHRKVSQVNTVSYHGHNYTVPPFNNTPLAGYTIEVRERPGQWIRLFYKGFFLAHYDFNNPLQNKTRR